MDRTGHRSDAGEAAGHAAVIDLRSDTVTKPTDGMRRAMMMADVGDDVYGEDPTVNALEERVAGLLGHEAGLFCATGSLANVLGVAQLVGPGQELLCDAKAHIVRAELGAHAALSGVTTRTWSTGDGRVDPDRVLDLVEVEAGAYLVRTGAVAVENTHNLAGGVVQPYGVLVELSRRVRGSGVGMHLDGARLWNAHVASGTGLGEYGQLFDTVNVCFSKGLGAPVGSMLVGSRDRIAAARVMRKRLGAGWRQAGMLAAAVSHALDHNVDRMIEDHEAARAFASAVHDRAPLSVDPPTVETNIVILDAGTRGAAWLAEAALVEGVGLSALGSGLVRAITHLDVTMEQAGRAGEVVGTLLAERR